MIANIENLSRIVREYHIDGIYLNMTGENEEGRDNLPVIEYIRGENEEEDCLPKHIMKLANIRENWFKGPGGYKNIRISVYSFWKKNCFYFIDGDKIKSYSKK